MNDLFCPRCGTRLETRKLEQRLRGFCPSCRAIHYQQPKLCVAALVEKEGALLLMRRGTAPFEGSWNLPAGYVDSDEDHRDAVRREVGEESGLDVEVVGLSGIYYFTDDPRGNSVLIAFICKIVGGSLIETVEGLDPTYFKPGTFPGDITGAGHDQAIGDWQRS